MSRLLRSTATPASSGFSATTGRSASERRDWYSMPSVSASARSLSQPSGPATPVDTFDARLLTFRARAADQAHAASTPDTTWPTTRVPARLISKDTPEPPISMPSERVSTPQQRTPNPGLPQPSASGTSSWSPPDAITAAPFPCRSPRRSSANAAQGGLTPTPAGPTPEGRRSSISRTAPPMSEVFYTTPPSAFVTHGAALLKGPVMPPGG